MSAAIDVRDGCAAVLGAIDHGSIPDTLPPPSIPVLPSMHPVATNGDLDAVSRELYDATDALDTAYIHLAEARQSLDRASALMTERRARLERAKHAVVEAILARRPR